MSTNGASHKINPFEDWLPLEEAAQRIGWSRTAIKYWAKQGHIDCWQVGQRVRLVYMPELKKYAATRKPFPKRSKTVDKLSNNG
jgi:excisionase family DNA binding protein